MDYNEKTQEPEGKYLDYLRKQDEFPVLILDITEVDFVADKDVYNLIKDSVMLSFKKGVHHKVLS